jgi:PKD repeat protein
MPIRPPDRDRGQSLAEFAIVLPVMLLLLLIAIDFGRVYLGWINLQNMARIAANYASVNPSAWQLPDDPTKQGQRATFATQIQNDAKATNCALTAIPTPTFPSGTDIGDTASVEITCRFGVITPSISQIVGSQVTVGASSIFPIRTGLTATGGGGVAVPNSSFTANPTTLSTGQTVTFTDTSTGGPTAWSWDFDGNSTTDSTLQNPTFVYTTAGSFQACLVAGNASGFDPTPACVTISVSSPGTVDFTANPVSGNGSVNVQFTDQSNPVGTAWAWDFDNNGSTDDTTQNPSHTYTTGIYSVKLTVTYPTGTAFLVKTAYINIGAAQCTVPDFSNTSTDAAQTTWSNAGFTTQVQFKQGNLPWTIVSQTITGGSTVLCSSSIRVSKTSQP